MKKVILWHDVFTGRSFDLLAHKDVLEEAEKEATPERLYQVECSHVKRFLSTHPDFSYIGSEDLCHIPEINSEIERYISYLERKGWRTYWLPECSHETPNM